jgi:hypothetical protein
MTRSVTCSTCVIVRPSIFCCSPTCHCQQRICPSAARVEGTLTHASVVECVEVVAEILEVGRLEQLGKGLQEGVPRTKSQVSEAKSK